MATRKTAPKTTPKVEKAIVDDGPKAPEAGTPMTSKAARQAQHAQAIAAPVSVRDIPDRNPDGTIVETRF